MNRGERELRIIGGRLRGRKLRFPDAPGLRPTPDRVRETLFNWLQARIPGSRCLDLFAGSGALGLEALSRGAAAVVFVESQRTAVQALRETIERFELQAATTLLPIAAERFLKDPPPAPFDVVFLDPPFSAGLLGACSRLLDAGGFLAPGAHIYLEHSAAEPLPALPAGWRAHRDGKAGEVGYHLYTAQARADSTETA